MKAIFMTKQLIRPCSEIYDRETRRFLEEKLEFIEPVYDLSKLDERIAELNEVEVIFSSWGMFSLDKDQIRKYFGRLKAVFYAAGSVQSFARPFLELGIPVFSAWAANAVPVAEYTVAQIVLANKGFFQRFHRSSNESWVNRSPGVSFPGNYNNSIGIIGCGMIGSLVARMLKGYNFRVLAFDPFLPAKKAGELNVELTSLERIFSECSVISNHLANNPRTVGMLDKKYFNLMKPNAAFINTGRGAQVVEDDLIAALEAEPCRVALLDVTMPEPPNADSRLYSLDNVFLTPHIAGSLGNEVARMGSYMAEEYARWSAGEPVRWQVSLEMLETMA